MSRYFFGLTFFLTSTTFVWGQETPNVNSQTIKKSKGEIVLDGNLDEEAWEGIEVADGFWLQSPRDDEKATVRTEVKLTFDDNFLYIAAICRDVENYVVQTLKRDISFFDGDGFGIVLDPINSQTNGFMFGLSPYNVQTEELLGPIAVDREDMTFSWDNRWFSATKRYEDYYVVEIAIPFKTLRFEADQPKWGINFFRNDLSRNQRYSWTPVPVNFEVYDLGYTGELLWEAAPTITGVNISVLPYASIGSTRDKEQGDVGSVSEMNIGLDAKVALTSSLNLDLTVNPDFSQVDVDVQQTNLTRFNLRYPERRPFFLENNDLFTEFGPNSAKPIFTRRLGLDADDRPVPINYGLRLSGNLGSKTRIGLLHMQTNAEDTGSNQNYSVAVVNHRVLDRSVIRGYVANRQAYNPNEPDQLDFGRNAGLEFNFLNKSGTWNSFASYHLSRKSDVGSVGTYANVGMEYASRSWKGRINYWDISSNYYSDIGFLPRLDNYDAERDTIIHLGWRHLMKRIGYVFRPQTGRIVAHDWELRNSLDYYPNGVMGDLETRLDYQIRFLNTSQLLVQPVYYHTQLIFSTRFTDAEPLPRGKYSYKRLNLSFISDMRKNYFVQTEVGIGQYYNGSLTRYLLQLNYRIQPWSTFSLGWEHNMLVLPEPYGERDLKLISGRAEINFSNRMFWTTFLQYNTQQVNFNINSRFQYRYRTMSDIFLVFTDNYFTTFPIKNRNKGLLLKINYMFNL